MSDASVGDWGMLLLRVVFGLLMAAHGAQKLFGWFGGRGLTTTGEFMVQLGFRSGPFFATAAGLAETLGGLLLATGMLGPVGPALIVSVMTVAAITVHLKNGLFAMSNGIEVPLLYATAAVSIAFMGAGRFSLDTVFGIGRFWTAGWIDVALVLGLLGGVGNIVSRRTRNPARS